MSGKTQKPVKQSGKEKEQGLLKTVNWLRNTKKSNLKTHEAIQYERRVEYFKGNKVIDSLCSAKFKGKGFPEVKSRADAVQLVNGLIRAGYFHRSKKVFTANRRWELEVDNQPFAEDGYYTWMYDGPKTQLYLMTAGLLLGGLGLCMIQIWPLWLKIGVWWCSVTFLTTFTILTIIRLILFCLCWIIGMRGYWLFPNLFDDNQTFAGSFQPVFGKGDPPPSPYDDYDDEDYDELNAAARRKAKKKQEEAEAKAAAAGKELEKRPKKTQEEQEKALQFGWINIVFIFGLGMLGCWNMGFFEAENVPDFVAQREDMQHYFPSLAPPEPEVKPEGEAAPEAEKPQAGAGYIKTEA